MSFFGYRKFEKTEAVFDWEVLSDTGFSTIVTAHKTIPYDVWEVRTKNFILHCADKHMVFKPNMEEIFVEHLKIGDKIFTENGFEKVVSVKKLNYSENMYDLQLNDFNQRYYSNGIMSHNTACASLYLLWYAMFIPDVNILVAAHKGTGADEILNRIRYAYEECPDHIRAGVTTWSSKKIVFDNKSSITCQTTTENTGRGLAISLLYCLDAGTVVRVRDKDTKEEKEIALESLYTELEGQELIDMKKVNLMRILFEDDYYVDVREDQKLLVNDVNSYIGMVTHGDEILIGQKYYTVKDILLLN